MNNFAQRRLERLAQLAYVLLLLKCGVRNLEIYQR